MGQAKEHEIQLHSIGLSYSSAKNICSNHFEDYAIAEFIEKNNSDELYCSFCKPKYQSNFVVSFDELMKFLMGGINYFYDDAANHLPYESAEGGYQGHHFSTIDLVYDIIPSEEENVIQEVLDYIEDKDWCSKYPFSLDEDEQLHSDWNEFSKILKHKMRYSFFKSKAFDSEYSVMHEILHQIALCIESLNLVITLPENQIIYRARQHAENDNPILFEDICSPKIKYCTLPNRMSPAGISMFYGTFELETAGKEVENLKDIAKRPLLSTGKFKLKKGLQVVDMTNIPDIPSIFDEDNRIYLYKISFLKKFVHEISKQIERDKYEHIEYVPTQVITEYFRYVVPELAGYDIDGIIYPSAVCEGKKCCVLFFDNEQCKDVFTLRDEDILTQKIDFTET